MMNKNVAIIPARGGSKGIPRKNLRCVAGRPLLSYTIEQAHLATQVSRIIVSTDDPEIAAVAQAWKAEVVWRPVEISGEDNTSESALLHVLDHLQDTQAYDPELIVFLQATSPLRRPNDIDNAINTFTNENADSLFSACAVQGFVWRQEREMVSSLSYDFRHRQRRQDAPQDLIENGSIYVFKPWVLREFNNRLGGKIAVYRMDIPSSFQVDEPEDLEVVEMLLTKNAPPANLPDTSMVQLLVLDFDGVMTDNRVLVNQDGTEAVWCHRGDGWGIERLKEIGVEILVLSTEANSVVEARCRKLGIACIQACSDKLLALEELARKRSLGPEKVAYVGNDVNDLDCLRWAGFAIAVADAVPEVRRVATFVTSRPGGGGAVREVCDLLRSHRKLPQSQAMQA
jgi:YrbI family 3-deoxy-D-manno-octulosonate 8-phosphate phosphatase